jgi:hypothetical protein
MPHVGEVAVKGVDRIHLAAGQRYSLSVGIELEEGFDGEVAISVENLPPGVSAAAALLAEKSKTQPAKVGGQIHKERYLAEQRSVGIMFMAAANAPLTLLPQRVQIVATPVLNGKLGRELPSQEILLTVSSKEEHAGAGPVAIEKSQQTQNKVSGTSRRLKRYM